MELRAIASVVGRHKRAALVGTVLAVALAFIAAFRLDFGNMPPFERRQPTTYESTVRLFVTQKGFPWGRSALRYASTGGQQTQLEGDPDRFSGLAVLYAQLANSEELRVGLSKKDKEAVRATVVPIAQFSSTALPLIDIAGKADSPTHARMLAQLVSQRFIDYIRSNQAAAKIPDDERIILEVVDPARLGKVVSGPSPALPALVLFTMLFATLGFIFVLDNWRGGRTVEASRPRIVEPVPIGVGAPEPSEDLASDSRKAVSDGRRATARSPRPGASGTLGQPAEGPHAARRSASAASED